MPLVALLKAVVRDGHLTLVDPAGRRFEFGVAGTSPRASFRVGDRETMRKIALRPRLALGEAYMDGSLTLEGGSLYELIDVLALNAARYDGSLPGRLLSGFTHWLRPIQQYNPLRRARRNVA